MSESLSTPTGVVLARTGRVLVEAGLPQGAADARLLLGHLLGLEPGELWRVAAVEATRLEALDDLVARRLAGTPVQHLIGSAWFAGRRYAVGPGVFIPRPETELLAQWGIERLVEAKLEHPVVLDLGTGAGVLAGTIAAAAPTARVHAVELSVEALGYARSNLAELGVALRHGDLADGWPGLEGGVDLVLSNPPYVPATLRGSLPAEVNADPDLALYSGADGLDAPLQVIRTAHAMLRPGGWLGMEHDQSHPSEVAAALAQWGFERVESVPDLAGRARFSVGQRGA